MDIIKEIERVLNDIEKSFRAATSGIIEAIEITMNKIIQTVISVLAYIKNAIIKLTAWIIRTLKILKIKIIRAIKFISRFSSITIGLYSPSITSILGYKFLGQDKWEIFSAVCSGIVSTIALALVYIKKVPEKVKMVAILIVMIIFIPIFILEAVSAYDNYPKILNLIESKFEKNNVVSNAEAPVVASEPTCDDAKKVELNKKEVIKLQTALKNDITIYPSGNTNGVQGILVAAAIKKFQSKYKLKVTGELDECTFGKIKEIFPQTYNK